MAENYCRFCQTNMKVKGIYNHSVDIFEKTKKPVSIADRFAGIGLTVVRESGKSARTWSRCVTILTHLEHDLPVYWQWKEDYGIAAASSSSDKREREPTPSKTPRDIKKLCTNPLSTAGAYSNPLSTAGASTARKSIREVCLLVTLKLLIT